MNIENRPSIIRILNRRGRAVLFPCLGFPIGIFSFKPLLVIDSGISKNILSIDVTTRFIFLRSQIKATKRRCVFYLYPILHYSKVNSDSSWYKQTGYENAGQASITVSIASRLLQKMSIYAHLQISSVASASVFLFRHLSAFWAWPVCELLL